MERRESRLPRGSQPTFRRSASQDRVAAVNDLVNRLPPERMGIPETQYARAEDGTHLAYKVLGDGPVDLVYLQPWFSHVEFILEEPLYERFHQRIASFSRLIIFDRRGSGMSDPVPVDRPPDLETRMDDARAVMDAVGSKRAVVNAASESGVLGCLFAATHPDRTVALIVIGCYPRAAWAPDYPWGEPREEHEASVARIESSWGTEACVCGPWGDSGSKDRRVPAVSPHVASGDGPMRSRRPEARVAVHTIPGREVKCE
jgi:pimeloyl-ACP methyl ester carboxylesterase